MTSNKLIIDKLRSMELPISYGRQQINDKDVGVVEKVLRSAFITTGSMAGQFEDALCQLTGAKHAIVCNNGTTALHLTCLALGVTQYDLGLTSPISFLSSANCVEFCDGRVDFIDIDLETLCLSPDYLEHYCNTVAVPKLVIPVDFAGVPADLPKIFELSKKYGFKIIEDAAHSIGSSYVFDGTEFQCGSCEHSDAAIFSFHPVKTITTGEGGAVLTNNDDVAKRVRKMRSHGVEKIPNFMRVNEGPWYYEMDELSYNCRITDFQCALGLSQLDRLDEFKSRRLEIFSKYNAVFDSVVGLITPPKPENASVCYHIYTLQFLGGSNVRNIVFEELRKYNIHCQVHYIPIYHQPYYQDKYHYSMDKCINSELYYSRCLTLPMYPGLDDDVIDFIIDVVLECNKLSGN